MTQSDDLAPSTLIRGRYEPLRPLGQGGQGEVLQARDHVHDRLVALKIYHVPTEGDRSVLLREARILLSIRPHPNLPLVREDFFVDDQRYAIVMDWIDGTDLRDALEEHGQPGLPFRRARRYLEQAAQALHHLHAHDPPVVHGDVKPSNLILTREGRLVLVDFGVSSQFTGDTESRATWGFAPPERLSGEALTPASDVFSLSATAAVLIQGSLPDLGARRSFQAKGRLRQARLRRAIGAGLALDPSRRPSPAELVARLYPWWQRALQPRTTRGRIVLALAVLSAVVTATLLGPRLFDSPELRMADPTLGDWDDRSRGAVSMAIAPNGRRGYLINPDRRTLVEIDMRNGEATRSHRNLPGSPNDVQVDEKTGDVLVLYRGSEEVEASRVPQPLISVVDRAWQRREIRVSRAPCDGECLDTMAIDAERRLAYVGLADQPFILSVHLDTAAVRRIPLPQRASPPTSLALQPGGDALFACSGSLLVEVRPATSQVLHVWTDDFDQECTSVAFAERSDRLHVATRGTDASDDFGAVWIVEVRSDGTREARWAGSTQLAPVGSLATARNGLSVTVEESATGPVIRLYKLEAARSRPARTDCPQSRDREAIRIARVPEQMRNVSAVIPSTDGGVIYALTGDSIRRYGPAEIDKALDLACPEVPQPLALRTA